MFHVGEVQLYMHLQTLQRQVTAGQKIQIHVGSSGIKLGSLDITAHVEFLKGRMIQIGTKFKSEICT